MADSGAELAEAYHRDVVGPLVLARWPGLPYAAARLGSGSDVLGLDDAVSRDHDWGLRLTLLVPEDLVPSVREHLEAGLPTDYAGWPTSFATTWRPHGGPGVEVDTVPAFTRSRLGVDTTDADGVMPAVDWLTLSGQSVLEVTAGPVFTDRDGALTRVRRRLAWYPDDVWRYVLAADWARLAQELPLAARAARRGDDVGSRVVMARLVGAATHLAFLLARRWPPYAKWRGTMFDRLPVAQVVGPALADALNAPTGPEREAALARALETLLVVQGDAGLPVTPSAMVPFWDRPFLGVDEGVAARLLASVEDEAVRGLPAGVGSVDQWVDSVEVLRDPVRRRLAVAAVLGP
ncbi:MAG: DUF4037 domain-containing protein [Lapillicoccus sp.]